VDPREVPGDSRATRTVISGAGGSRTCSASCAFWRRHGRASSRPAQRRVTASPTCSATISVSPRRARSRATRACGG